MCTHVRLYRQKLAAALFCLCNIGPVAGAGDLSELVLPPGASTVWIGENIEQNGVPMQIQALTSSASVDQVLSFYRSQWENSADPDIPGFVENQVGEWQTISQLENDLQTVIQIKASSSGGVEGFVSQIDIRATPGSNRTTRNFPRKNGSQLISSTESNDSGKTATTILLMNTFSVASNTSFYQSQMPGKGWSLAYARNHSGVSMMLFNRSGRSCEIAISKDRGRGRTIVMANILISKT